MNVVLSLTFYQRGAIWTFALHVQLHFTIGRQKTVGEISKEYGIARPIVSRWLAEYKRYGNNAFAGKGNRLPEAARIYVLEKENEQLKEELTILKKFQEFAKNQKR